MHEERKEKTAFTARSGKYEFNFMPFGLTNVVATFYAQMDKHCHPLSMGICVMLFDNCLIFIPDDFNLHLKQLDQVLKSINYANMQLQIEKCKFVFSEVPFLGHYWKRRS